MIPPPTLVSGYDVGRASSVVYEDLRRQIVAMTLPPGTTIDRAALGERYGVSQSPVREAIQRLEQDGLVKAFPQSRTVVTRIDVSRVAEEHFHRMSVECEVVRRLAERGDVTVLTSARGLLRTQEALVGDVGQIDLFRQLDDAFHEHLFHAVGQIGLHRHIRSRSGQMARLRTLDLPSDGKMRAVFQAHHQVVEAIGSGDPFAASETMRRHLSGTIDRLADMRAESPNFFHG